MRTPHRILTCAGIFACLLLAARLYAEDRPVVEVFAPKELAAPLAKISDGAKSVRLDLQSPKDLQHWLGITDAGIFVVIAAHPKAFLGSIDRKQAMLFLQKDDTVYTVSLVMAGLSIPPDPMPSRAAYASLFGSTARDIFHSFGYEPAPKDEPPIRKDPVAIGWLLWTTTETDPKIRGALMKTFQDKIPIVITDDLGIIEVGRSDEKAATTLLAQYLSAHPDAKRLYKIAD